MFSFLSDGGASVMRARLESPRARRLILRCAPSPSGTLLKQLDPIRQTIRVTVGPSISANDSRESG
jgi:hypothetical protein